MTSTGKQIAALMMDTGKTAAEMTHGIKVLGNGSMQGGLARIGAYFAEEVAIAATKGRMQGAVVGILSTIAIGGTVLFAKKRNSKRKKHEDEGQAILTELEGSDVDDSISQISDEMIICESNFNNENVKNRDKRMEENENA